MKKALIIIALIVAVLGVSIGSHFLAVHLTTKEHNLIKVDRSNVPDRVETPFVEGKAKLSEIDMQYYVVGEGYPVIMVHGNGSNHTKLEDLARRLANHYKVYLIESRCHGGSTVTDEISYDLMADDIHEFIEVMGIEKPILIGHSDGGINGLTLAIRHPDDLKALVSFGANTEPKEFKFYFTLMVKVNNLFNKSILNDMMLNEPHITKEQLQSIKIPTYVIAGEFDIMKLRDTLYIADTIPGSQLAILAGQDHSGYVHDGTKSYNLVHDFIEGVLNG